MKDKTIRRTSGTPSRQLKGFVPPLTVSHPDLLVSGSDRKFREMIYLMVLAFGRLQFFREAFGRAISLTGSQFVVLMGTALRQGSEGVSIRALADHTHLAATHVTTEVGKLIAKGLLTKSANPNDRRSVLVRLSPAGEKAIGEVTPFVRRVNDVLFQHVTTKDLTTMVEFLNALLLNSDYAEVEVRRFEHDRSAHRTG
jgi:DNA-binding MarR family transcriptional regulator